jgi:Lon protease-like protein
LSILLPLFPLDLVLFPGSLLPLHIFEPRYREMISECLEQHKPFGVVRAKEDGIAETGCTAEIVSVTKKYDDGRMDILTQGRARFEIVQVSQARAFLQAEVIYLPDEVGRATSAEEALAVTLHAEAMALAGAQTESSAENREQPLSFHLAGSLPLDLDFKQTLLETRLEAERVRTLISFFESILPSLRRSVHVRQKAGGNGHAS